MVRPELKNTVGGFGRSVRAYMVGDTIAIYVTEVDASTRVKDFTVFFTKSSTEQMTIGLLTFVSMLDIVSPQLTQEGRGQIAQEMLDTVLTNDKDFNKDMNGYQLDCYPVKGVWCSFTAEP